MLTPQMSNADWRVARPKRSGAILANHPTGAMPGTSAAARAWFTAILGSQPRCPAGSRRIAIGSWHSPAVPPCPCRSPSASVVAAFMSALGCALHCRVSGLTVAPRGGPCAPLLSLRRLVVRIIVLRRSPASVVWLFEANGDVDAKWKALVSGAWAPLVRVRFHQVFLVPLLVIGLVCSLAFAGRTLLWCPWMQQLRSHSCCTPSSDEAARSAPAIDRAPCCEAKTYPVCQAARSEPEGGAYRSAAGELITVLASFDASLSVTGCTLAAKGHERRARAGPDIPLYDLNCAYLI